MNKDWFFVEGSDFQIRLSPTGVLDDRYFPYLFGFWTEKGWYVEPNAVLLDIIVLFTCPINARKYIGDRYPVTYFGISEPGRIPFPLRRFRVVS